MISAKGFSARRISYFERLGFRYAHIVPLGKKRQQPFLVRKQGNESAVHTFVVESLRQYFLRKGLRPKRWITVGADLTLRQKNSSTLLAIEVETGGAYRIDKERLIRKFGFLQSRYDVVIVLTNSYYKRRYQHLFPEIPILLRKNAIYYFSRRRSSLGFPSPRHTYYRRN